MKSWMLAEFNFALLFIPDQRGWIQDHLLLPGQIKYIRNMTIDTLKIVAKHDSANIDCLTKWQINQVYKFIDEEFALKLMRDGCQFKHSMWKKASWYDAAISIYQLEVM